MKDGKPVCRIWLYTTNVLHPHGLMSTTASDPFFSMQHFVLPLWI